MARLFLYGDWDKLGFSLRKLAMNHAGWVTRPVRGEPLYIVKNLFDYRRGGFHIRPIDKWDVYENDESIVGRADMESAPTNGMKN